MSQIAERMQAVRERIAKLIDEATVSDAKALVLRVDSGGGSVFASEQIRTALERFKAKGNRPVAVSMVNYAASGGYWVSTPACWGWSLRATRASSARPCFRSVQLSARWSAWSRWLRSATRSAI